MSKKNMTNEEVIRFHRHCILMLMDSSVLTGLTAETQNLIKAHLDMIVHLAGAEAPLDFEEPIPAQSILDELHRRNLHTHPTDAPVTAKAALDALRTVLDGVDAVFGRVADVGGAVEVPGPNQPIAKALRALIVAVDMWEEDMRTRPSLRPTEVIRETYARMREARQDALDVLNTILTSTESK